MAKNNAVTIKISPQLVRRRVVTKTPSTSVRIIVKPSNRQSVSLNEINKINVNVQNKPPEHAPMPGAAVTKQHLIKPNQKKIKVKHSSRDITQDSLTKIKQLKNYGHNKILVIIGNGPSINEVPLDQLKTYQNIHTLSINRPDPRVWPTTHWAFFDQSQMHRHEHLWNGYNGFIFNSVGIKKQKENSLQIKTLGGKGFSRDLTKGLYIGRSSVFAAMQIGHWMSYNHIYIFGCDMNPAGLNGQLHFYGINPDVKPDVRIDRFKKESEHYDYAAGIMDESERHRYTFCSSENPWGFVHKFISVDHKVAIPIIITHSKELPI